MLYLLWDRTQSASQSCMSVCSRWCQGARSSFCGWWLRTWSSRWRTASTGKASRCVLLGSGFVSFDTAAESALILDLAKSWSLGWPGWASLIFLWYSDFSWILSSHTWHTPHHCPQVNFPSPTGRKTLSATNSTSRFWFWKCRESLLSWWDTGVRMTPSGTRNTIGSSLRTFLSRNPWRSLLRISGIGSRRKLSVICRLRHLSISARCRTLL